jgi:putative membrane protein
MGARGATMQALITCERLIRTPVPLVYTRHTSRFLGLWVLLLPFALVRELHDHFILVPICDLVAVFFFGIEELGIREAPPCQSLKNRRMLLLTQRFS